MLQYENQCSLLSNNHPAAVCTTYQLATLSHVHCVCQLLPYARPLRRPAELGYGKAGSGPIPGNATLIFEVRKMGRLI